MMRSPKVGIRPSKMNRPVTAVIVAVMETVQHWCDESEECHLGNETLRPSWKEENGRLTTGWSIKDPVRNARREEASGIVTTFATTGMLET